MRTLSGFAVALLAAAGLMAQNRSGLVNPLPITRTLPSVIYPGGTSALPGVQRTTGSVLYPGGGGPQIGVPAAGAFNNLGLRGGAVSARRHTGTGVVAYPLAYPVYVGGYGYSGYDPNAADAAPAAQQPNVTVIMPPQAPPVIINQFGQGAAPGAAAPPTALYQAPPPESAATEPAQPNPEPTQYLIAFKDHTIYAAIAYWVDGDTLHYFTAGNTHNQVSLSLVDRALTERLNRESGIDLRLPAGR